jgi:hypothetical protein
MEGQDMKRFGCPARRLIDLLVTTVLILPTGCVYPWGDSKVKDQ